jgi:hypothetical protein
MDVSVVVDVDAVNEDAVNVGVFLDLKVPWKSDVDNYVDVDMDAYVNVDVWIRVSV